MARLLALCSLPRTNPGNRLQYVRRNGPYTLYMNDTCSSAQGLALPRVGEGLSGIQVAVIVDAILEEVEEMDDREVADALRFVLHVTRGDPCPKTFENMLD